MVKNKRFLAGILTGMIFLTSGCFFNNGMNPIGSGKDNNNGQAQIISDQETGDENNQNDPDNGNGNEAENPDKDNTDPDNGNSGNVEETSDYILPAMQTEYHGMYDGYIYYREYSSKDVYSPVFPYFGEYFNINLNYDTHKIYRMDEDGNQEVFAKNDPGIGTLCVAGGKLFSQKNITDDMGIKYQLYYYELDSDTPNFMEGYSDVIGSYDKYVFVRDAVENEEYGYIENHPCIFDAETMTKIATFEGTYLGADKDGVYYSYAKCDLENDLYGLAIYRVDYSGKTTTLADFDYDVFKEWTLDWGGPEVTCIQFLNDQVIFNVGYYAGTGHFYNEGFLYMVGKDGKSGENLGVTMTDTFYYAVDGDHAFVSLYQYNENDGDNSPMFVDIDEGEGSHYNVDYIGQVCKKPYVYYQDRNIFFPKDSKDVYYSGEVMIYADESIDPFLLVSVEDYENYGFKYGYSDVDYEISDITEIYNIEYVGDKLFYTIGELIRDSENDIGWRYAYNHGRTADFVKDLKTGEVTLLFEY